MDKSTISMAIFNSYVSLPEDGDLTTWRHWNVQVAAWYQPDQHTHTHIYIYYMFAAGTDSFLIGPWLGSMCLSWHAWSYMQCRCKLSREPFFAYQNHIFMQHHARAAQDIFSIFPRRPVFLCFTSMLMMVKWCSISIYLYFSWCTFSIIVHGLIIIFEHFSWLNHHFRPFFHGEHTIHDSDLRSAFKEMSRQYREMQAWGHFWRSEKPAKNGFNMV